MLPIRNGNIGLYRDDGLAVFKSNNARALDKKQEKIFQNVLQKLGLKITAPVPNLKVVNYLDVTLDLSHRQNITHIENQITTHCTSMLIQNHPPSIIKQLPKIN